MSLNEKTKTQPATDTRYLAHLLEATITDTRADSKAQKPLETQNQPEISKPSEIQPPLQPALPSNLDNEMYFKIWTIEQAHTTTRWTVTTFFLSISFAIFGFSFQAQLTEPRPLIARLSGLVIYWFAYFLFTRFNRYTELLRSYMHDLELQQRTSLTIQTRARQQLRTGLSWKLSATRMLFYFGILYGCTVALLWWFGW